MYHFNPQNTLLHLMSLTFLLNCSASKTDKRTPSPSPTSNGSEESKVSQSQDVASAKASPNPTPSPLVASSTAVPDYAQLYCSQINKVKTRFDVSQELSYFCKDGQSTAEFAKLKGSVLTTGGFTEITLKSKHEASADRSDFIMTWAYLVPLRPIEIKSRPLYDFIAQKINTNTLSLTATAKRLPDSSLDSKLHLWSVNMHYDLKVKAAANLSLESSRDTQYNLYQVQDGNEEMGFAVEAMTANQNPDYYRSVMINLTFNDGKGSSIILVLLHITMNNRGFPSTATDTINEIAHNMAKSMYEGLNRK